MNHSIEMVPLREILTPSETWVNLSAETRYRQVTVRLWGQGVVQRDEVAGTEIAAKKRLVASKNQFIISRIDARNGACGIVPEFLDGAVVSNDFPLFNLNTKRVEPRFLHWISKTRDFVNLCSTVSEGTTNRVRLDETKFLNATIPLPDLPEQQRIVSRIEALAGKIEEARRLRGEGQNSPWELLARIEHGIWSDQTLKDGDPLEEVTTFLARGRQSLQGDSDHYLIKTQHVQMGRYIPTNLRLAPEVAGKVSRESLVKEGDVLIACSAAGCLGRVARYDSNGVMVSTDTHVAIARADRAKVTPEYLYAFLRSAPGQIQLRSREKGDWTREKVGFRLSELNIADLRTVPVPVPSPTRQQQIVGELDRLHRQICQFEQAQSAVSAELDALLPAILDRAFKGEL